jgi:hypothetical protein
MTSGDAVPRASVLPSGAGARLVAAATALVLALTVLVAPGARAADDLIPTTMTVEQRETWWAGTVDHPLEVRTTTPDGAFVTGGRLIAEVAGIDYAGTMWASSGRMNVRLHLAPGTYPAIVRYYPPDGYAATEWTGTVVVSDGTIRSAISAQAPDALTRGNGGDVRVSVTADGGTPEGRVELRGPNGRAIAMASLVDGAAVLHVYEETVRQLPLGDVTFEVVFHGVDGVRSASVPVRVQIVKARRALDVRIPGGNTWDLGDDFWKVAVDVPDAAGVGGKLSLYDGSRLLQRIDAEDYPRTEVFVLTPRALKPGRHRLDVRLTGSRFLQDASASVTVQVKRPATTSDAERVRPLVWGTKTHPLRVRVWPAKDNYLNDGHPPTGTVAVYQGRKKLGSARFPARGSEVVVRISGKSLPVGRTSLRFVYSGDSRYRGSTRYETVKVHRAATKTRVKILDRHVEGSERAKVRVKVTSPSNLTPKGTLQVKVGGKVVKTVRLKERHDGVRTITLPRLSKTSHAIKVVMKKSAVTKRSASGYVHVWVR